MEEQKYDIITLTDSEGQDVDFVYITTIEYQGREFCILVDSEEIGQEENEATILEIVEGEDGDEYVGVSDLELLNAIFDMYKATEDVE